MAFEKINTTNVQANETNVNWIANGEKANEVVLNRPAKEVAEIVNANIDAFSDEVQTYLRQFGLGEGPAKTYSDWNAIPQEFGGFIALLSNASNRPSGFTYTGFLHIIAWGDNNDSYIAKGTNDNKVFFLSRDGAGTFIFHGEFYHTGNDGSGSGLNADQVDGIEAAQFARRDQANTMSNFLTLHADPVNDLHAATKKYVDTVAQGLALKEPVRVATTNNITLSGHQSIDGVTTTNGMRVLVKDQTDKRQNGIYVASSTAWDRAEDADGNPSSEVTTGMFTFVEGGSTNQSSSFVLATAGNIIIGTTNLTFVQFASAGQLEAGTGINKTGDILSFDQSYGDGRYVRVGGKASDSDKLDGLNSTQFLRSDQNDTMNGSLLVTTSISSNGAITSGVGSGGVAMTVNDGAGNANLTFNHQSARPEQAGNSGRISVNTDETSNASMIFGLAQNVSGDGSIQATQQRMALTEQYLNINTLTGMRLDNNRSITLGDGSVQIFGNGANSTYESNASIFIKADKNNSSSNERLHLYAGVNLLRISGGSSANSDALTFNGSQVLTTASGKAVDSVKLDGLNSTQFLRSDANDTFSGTLTKSGNGVALEIPSNTNVPETPTTQKQKLIGLAGNGGLYQISGRGGLMLTSNDDALILANGDHGKNFTSGTNGINAAIEDMYFLSDGGFTFKSDLQEGFGSEFNMVFTDGGRLGIRTATPSEPLEVKGNMRSDGQLYLESVNYAANQVGGLYLQARNSAAGWAKQRHGIFLKSDGTGSPRVSVDTSDVEVMTFSTTTGATAINGLRAGGTNQLQLRPSGGSNVPTVIHRNDGNEYYVLLSNATNDFNSTFNSLRPLNINLTSGRLSSSNGQTFNGGTSLGGQLDMNNNDIVGVDQIAHEGDSNTYMQFHDSDKWRVVTGGAQQLEVNNNSVIIDNELDLNGRLNAYGVNHSNSIRIDDNNANQDLNAINIDYNVTGSQALTQTRYHHAHRIDVDFAANGDQTNGENRVYGHTIDVDVNSNGRLRRAYGLNADVRTSADAGNSFQIIGSFNSADNETGGTANVNDTIGSNSLAYFGSTSSTASNSLYGASNIAVYSSNATARINNIHGARNEVQIDNNTLTSGEKIGNIFATQSIIDQNDADAGVKATNAYLFYGQYEGTAANNQFGVYINNDVPSLFKGELRLESDNYGNHLKLKRLSETWDITLSTDGSLDFSRSAGTGSAIVDVPGLRIGNNVAWHAGNDGPGSGLHADLLDGLHASNFLRSDASDIYARNNGILSFDMVSGERATSTSARAPIEVRNQSSSGDAFMQFHISGKFAAYFGIDRDINDFFVGGYSMGNNRYRVWHDGNRTKFTPGTAFDLGTEDLNSFSNDAAAGFYYQQANSRTTGKNYPAELAGSLLVQKSAQSNNIGSTQLYITYNNSDMYFRGLYGNTPAWRKVWHDGNDGPGSGLNADLLDGLQESTFMRRSANSQLDMNNNDIIGVDQIAHEGDSNTYMQFPAGDQWRVVTGGVERLLINNATTNVRNDLRVEGQILTTDITTSNGTQLVLNAGEAVGKFTGQTGEFVYANAESGFVVSTPDRTHPNFETGYTADITTIRGDAIFINGNEVFHAGNDGPGSGLNADLLDGLNSSQFLRSDANDTFSSTLTISGAIHVFDGGPNGSTKFGRNTDQYVSFYGNSGGNIISSVSDAGNPKNNLRFQIFTDGGTTADSTYTLSGTGGNIWHEGNDGPGSGLHADLLDGFNATTSDAVNTVAVRDGSGDINCRLVRSSYPSQSTPPDSADIAFRNNDSNDNYVRFTDRTGLLNYLELGNRFATKSTTKSDSLGDSAWIASYVDANNRDHVWHDEGSNTWHFVSDSPFKSTGNSKIQVAEVKASGLSKFSGKVMFAGDGNLSNQNSNLAIGIGDADTGFKWNSDGDFSAMANNTQVTRFTRDLVSVSANLTVDDGTNTTVQVLCDDAGEAELKLMGTVQGTGRLYVGQSDTYGGGIEYNGDGTPAGSGSGGDFITLYRKNNGTLSWTARNSVNDSDWEFRANITAYSDERLKDNFNVIENALDKVCSLTGYTFNRIDTDYECRQAGFKAQDVQKVLPEVVNVGKDEMQTLSLDYGKMGSLYVEAIKELKSENDELKSKVSSMEETMSSMEEMLLKLAKEVEELKSK
jgi:hypothetical protein